MRIKAKIQDLAIEITRMESLRRTGRTTRLVDHYIQELFNKPGEWVFIKDHEGPDNSHIWMVVNKRLASEHRALYSSVNFEALGSNYRMRIVIDPKVLTEIKKRMG